MVTVKDAVASALQFATGILSPDRTADIRLEEVDLGTHNGQEVWLVTLSLRLPSPGAAFLAPRPPRDFKTFMIDKHSGEVLAMKIRELAGA